MRAFTHQNRRTRQRNRASEKDKRTFRRKRKKVGPLSIKTQKPFSTHRTAFECARLRTQTEGKYKESEHLKKISVLLEGKGSN